MKHYLSFHDPETRTGVCRACGPTTLRKKGEGKWRCTNSGRRETPEAKKRAAAWYRSYYAENREQEIARSKRWAANNPDRVNEYAARKRGARKGNADYSLIHELDKGICYLCGSTDRPTVDHLIPVDGGGDHDNHNLAIACLPCNSSKGRKMPHELDENIRELVEKKLEQRKSLHPGG